MGQVKRRGVNANRHGSDDLLAKISLRSVKGTFQGLETLAEVTVAVGAVVEGGVEEMSDACPEDRRKGKKYLQIGGDLPTQPVVCLCGVIVQVAPGVKGDVDAVSPERREPCQAVGTLQPAGEDGTRPMLGGDIGVWEENEWFNPAGRLNGQVFYGGTEAGE